MKYFLESNLHKNGFLNNLHTFFSIFLVSWYYTFPNNFYWWFTPVANYKTACCFAILQIEVTWYKTSSHNSSSYEVAIKLSFIPCFFGLMFWLVMLDEKYVLALIQTLMDKYWVSKTFELWQLPLAMHFLMVQKYQNQSSLFDACDPTCTCQFDASKK